MQSIFYIIPLLCFGETCLQMVEQVKQQGMHDSSIRIECRKTAENELNSSSGSLDNRQ